jgi:hypothetical protein
VSNLLELLSLIEDDGTGTKSPAALAGEMVDSNLKVLKTRVAEAVVREMEGSRELFREFLDKDGGRFVDEMQERGAEAARQNAEQTMSAVRSAVGL